MAASVSNPTLSPLEPLVDRIESLDALDAVAQPAGAQVRSTIPAGPVKDALSGTWLGHALHPLLTDVVIGSFLSATLLDFLGGRENARASERLLTVGIATYGPTALTGVSDWADAEPVDTGVRRTGLVHAATNGTALALYTFSLLARKRGAHRRGVMWGVLGAGALGVGGFLGGHLSYRQGIGADQTVFDTGPEDWVRATDASSVPEGTPTRVVVEDTPVLILREGSSLFAIHDRCSHRGCALSEGSIEGGEVVCACHGSRFSLRDGALRRGPATAPQPAFDVRERDGALEIRRIPTPA
jgi:nitrite reductase/ring-hydroxylating ferredoxin subunit/uncharacterized membrane protein